MIPLDSSLMARTTVASGESHAKSQLHGPRRCCSVARQAHLELVLLLVEKRAARAEERWQSWAEQASRDEVERSVPLE